MQTETQAAETELLRYWQKLTSVQRDLVVNLIKNIVGDEAQVREAAEIPQEQWDKIHKEREAHNAGSKSYTWDEVKNMARNKEKRHVSP